MPKLVVVDPGHGGDDPGAQGHGLSEAALTLKISRRLRRRLLRDFDVDVKLTRSDDSTLALDDRAAFANELGADYFVSVHINSGGGSGYESFIHRSAAAGSSTARRQSAVHRAAMEFMSQRGVQDRGKKTAGFAVLRQTQMPAVLTETLFIDTGADADLLKDDRFLTGVANAYARGVAKALSLSRRQEAGRPAIHSRASDGVHRDLQLTNPLTGGADVKVLQQTLNKIAGDFPRILDFELLEDGKLGEKTLQATVKCAHVMGVIRSRLNQIEKQHVIIKRVQHVLRRPEIRSDAQKQRAEERRERLRRQLDQRPSLAGIDLTLTAGRTHWGGSNDVMTEFVEPFMVKRGLPIGSGKRTPAHNAAIGGSATSDHLTTRTTVAARDFPTFAGEDDARAPAKAMGIDGWQPNAFTTFPVAAGGRNFRLQILWGTAINHGDHVHVGISRV